MFSQKICLYLTGSSFPLCFDSRFHLLSFRLSTPAVYFFSNDLVSSKLFRFEVLTVVLLKIQVLWHVRQNWLFVDCVALKIKALRSFERSVNVYESLWLRMPMKLQHTHFLSPHYQPIHRLASTFLSAFRS